MILHTRPAQKGAVYFVKLGIKIAPKGSGLLS